jgi:vitamin B12 transporter
MKKTVKISVLLALTSAFAFSQETEKLESNLLDEVIISDTKFAQSKEKSGKVVEVISAEDLAKKSGQNLATILTQVAGVEINSNQSANGKNLGYYIRGGKNRQVLILIDGIPISDASGITTEYDLRLLPVEQVERIEVMKGAASTLHGTGAATGVINIILKKSSKKEIQGNAYLNIGSNNTANNSKYNGDDFNQGISVNGEVKKVNYFAGFNSTETTGMSQIAANDGEKYEEDRFSRQNLVTKLGFKATDNLTLDFFGNYDKIKNDFDFTYDGTGFNDINVNETTSEQVRFGFSPKYKYNKGEFVLNSGFTKIKRDYNEFNSWTNTTDYSIFQSRSVVLDVFNKLNLTNEFALILGINYQFQDMLSQTPYSVIEKEFSKFNILDGYATLIYNSNFGLNVNLGSRWNHHSEYGNHVVYNFNPSYHFKTSFPLKVLASYSTAFVSPSLFQLYSEFGNTNLNPEKNTTIEAGFETELWNKKVKLNSVAFYRDQDDTIDFFYNPDTFTSSYVNINGENKAKGVETSVLVSVSEKANFNANYTFTQVDKALDRLIPKHKVNASIDYQLFKKTLLTLNYQYFSQRNDAFYNGNTFVVENVNLKAYQLASFLVKHELIKDRMTVFGTVTNLFNEDFVENVGYSTRGRNFKIGVNIVL